MTAVIVLCVVILVFVLINSLLVVTLHRLNRNIDASDPARVCDTEPQPADKVKPINEPERPENDLKKAE